MLQYFLSENLKTKNTFSNKLVWIMPMLTIILSLFLTADYFQVDSYNWWYTMMLPGFISLYGAMLGRLDGSMKNRALLPLPIDLKKVWLAKVLVGIKNLSIACFIIFLCTQFTPFISPEHAIGKFTIFNCLFATVLLIITFMWQLPLCMVMGKKIGLFATTFISLVINIISTILAVKGFWWANPFSYPARLMCPVLKILPNGLLAEAASVTFTPEVMNVWVIPFGVIVSSVLLLITTYLTINWFERQEVI